MVQILHHAPLLLRTVGVVFLPRRPRLSARLPAVARPHVRLGRGGTPRRFLPGTVTLVPVGAFRRCGSATVAGDGDPPPAGNGPSHLGCVAHLGGVRSRSFHPSDTAGQAAVTCVFIPIRGVTWRADGRTLTTRVTAGGLTAFHHHRLRLQLSLRLPDLCF